MKSHEASGHCTTKRRESLRVTKKGFPSIMDRSMTKETTWSLEQNNVIQLELTELEDSLRRGLLATDKTLQGSVMNAVINRNWKFTSSTMSGDRNQFSRSNASTPPPLTKTRWLTLKCPLSTNGVRQQSCRCQMSGGLKTHTAFMHLVCLLVPRDEVGKQLFDSQRTGITYP